jgi:hypothetical protein
MSKVKEISPENVKKRSTATKLEMVRNSGFISSKKEIKHKEV